MRRPINERVRNRTNAIGSQLRRYPREIIDSLRPMAPHPPHVAHSHAHAHDRFSNAVQSTLEAESDALHALWLGHASALIRLGGCTVLTDPVLSHRIGPRVGTRTLGPARLAHVPALAPSLRGVRVILLSHAHYDHLDIPSLEALASPRTTVITASGAKGLVPQGFRRVIELPWGRTIRVDGLSITAAQADHWGARYALDRWRRHNAYVIEAGGARALFAGDTALTGAFDSLAPIDLAMLGIGAYEGWKHRHATPEQAWEMFTRMRGRVMMPTHHATFDMGERTPDEPLRRLLHVAGDEAHRIICREPGQAWKDDAPSAPR